MDRPGSVGANRYNTAPKSSKDTFSPNLREQMDNVRVLRLLCNYNWQTSADLVLA